MTEPARAKPPEPVHEKLSFLEVEALGQYLDFEKPSLVRNMS